MALSKFFIRKILSKVRAPGFEPGTYRVSVDCSSQLSYARTFDRINFNTIPENTLFNKRNGWRLSSTTLYSNLSTRAPSSIEVILLYLKSVSRKFSANSLALSGSTSFPIKYVVTRSTSSSSESRAISSLVTFSPDRNLTENSIFYKEKGPTRIAPARLRTHFRRGSSPSLRIYRPLHVRPRGNSPRTGTLVAELPPPLTRRCGQVVAEEDQSERGT